MISYLLRLVKICISLESFSHFITDFYVIDQYKIRRDFEMYANSCYTENFYKREELLSQFPNNLYSDWAFLTHLNHSLVALAVSLGLSYWTVKLDPNLRCCIFCKGLFLYLAEKL